MVHLGKNHPNADTEKLINAPHPFRIPLGEIIVHRNEMNALASQSIEYTGKVAINVLPSPVRISAILPLCSTMPPINCTSKWRIAEHVCWLSRTTANASGKTASRLVPSSMRCLNSSVFARSSASVSGAILALQRVDSRYRLEILFDQPIIAASEDFL